MRQIWITKIGPPEVLEVKEAPDPEPKAGEVRIRVEASGVNFADIMGRLGLYPDLPCACRKSNSHIQMVKSAKKWHRQNATNACCVYRKLKHGRSGDEVHPGWRVN